ncbi:hypothetical protein ACFXTN_000166 [Malus domestica]
MNDNDSLSVYIAKLFDLINQLKSYGEDLSNQRIVQKLLISLPKSYDSIASMIENTKDLDTIDAQDVVAILKGYEQRLDRHGESSMEKAFANLNIAPKSNRFNSQSNSSKHQKKFKTKGKQWGNKAEWGNKASFPVKNDANNTGDKCKFCDRLHYGECWVKNKVKCHKCNKIGHIARYCNSNKAVQQVNFANQVEENGNLFYANHSGEMKKISDEWYIDSGCSNHMTSREDLLVDINRNVKAKVQVGTGNLVEVAGKGTLIIETMKGRSYIRDVMLVPEVFGMFKKFRTMVELQCGYSLKKLRSDRGGEFTSTEFNAFCESIGMERQLTVSYTPQQNGVAKRKNRTIVEMAKSMLHEKDLPYKLWGEAVNTTVYLLNRCPTSALNCVTPFEAYSGRRPGIKHLKVFGAACYSLIPRYLRHKLEASSIKGVFIGYAACDKGYRILNPTTMKVIMSRDVVFDENGKWD